MIWRGIVIAALSGILSFGCVPDYSSDRIVGKPDGSGDAQLLLSYLNGKEKSNRDNPSFYYHRSNIRFESGMIPGAIEDIEKAISLNSEQAGYYELKARLMTEKGSNVRALSAALQAQELGSRGPQTYIAMANAWASLEYYQKALDALETAISILPLDADLHYLKASILSSMGEEQNSTSILLKVLEIDPDYAPALVDLINIHMKNEDPAEARELILKILEIDGMESRGNFLYADWLYHQGEYDSASMILNRLREKSEFREQCFRLLGDIKLDSYQYDSALYFARRLLDLDSMDTDAWLLNARAYDRKRFYDKSRENYEKILAIDSGSQLVKDELAKLERKVAYLRKLEQQRQERPPLIPLKPREIKN